MILRVKGVEFSYENKKKILSDVNFELDKGSFLTILGPNGAGKSTLLNCITNLLKPTRGELWLKDQLMCGMDLKQVAKTIAYVPQVHIPTYEFTSLDFVVMGRSPHLGMFQKPTKADYDIAKAALVQLDSMELAEKPYTKLSGGERQLVTIARAIAQEAELIVFDEPTAYLDYGNQIRILKLIKTLTQRGYSVIMTTHSPDHAFLLGGKIGILDYHGGLQIGAAEEVLQEEVLARIYGTDVRVIYVKELGRSVCAASLAGFL
ncbi:ABC transporter ATP-binding protein [Aminipila butyrica]|uniref:ABC transporter ATP-binding protein n=1 Tax=Aminipila butyrica TaxID=433296 RepID=A0A858BYN3_9FIRM|nr:ABC transporter ATP-binding protein [Aminipila butyrica]QIB70329.1 ABC transporter ATP-binding protein [Aminipila butyrica]